MRRGHYFSYLDVERVRLLRGEDEVRRGTDRGGGQEQRGVHQHLGTVYGGSIASGSRKVLMRIVSTSLAAGIVLRGGIVSRGRAFVESARRRRSVAYAVVVVRRVHVFQSRRRHRIE